MARFKEVVDECLAVATAFSDISSDTYNELGSIDFEDNDKLYPFFLFDKRSLDGKVNSYTRNNLPKSTTYTQTFYFFDTFTESEKVSSDLQTKEDALKTIADKYFAELRQRNESGSNGFFLVDTPSFNVIDETHNDRVIQISYNLEIEVLPDDCSLGNFTYSGVEQPTNLVKTSNSDTQIVISWTDNATNEASYEVYRSLDCVNFNLLATIAANSTTHTDTGLTAETVYVYKVRAITATANGKFSNTLPLCTDNTSSPCVDATVENSDVSYSNTVASGATLVLPDITHVDSDGSSSITPAQNVFTAALCTAQSGIAYDRPNLTGQSTSYRTGDDGWHLTNGTYLYNPPAFPTSYARLDTTHLTPFLKLVDNNAFGNKDRFTALDGTQTITADYVIDHLTGLGWNRVPKGVLIWDALIDVAVASADNGYSDWRMMNKNEFAGIADYELTNKVNYSPFNMGTNAQSCSTTSNVNSLVAYYFQNASDGRMLTNAKTGGIFTMNCRNHY